MMFGDIAPDHRARKRFGQNFLTDRSVIDRIIRAIAPSANDTLIEIGPGRGALTNELIDSGAMVHLVELDRDLGEQWQRRTGTKLQVHINDALRFDFSTLAPAATRLRVVGNLPYNISSPLLFHLLRFGSQIEDMHFMLQREVVERMAAEAATADYGRLTVMIQYHCAVENLFEVPASAFSPAPKVVSAVVRLTPRPYPGTPLRSHKTLSTVVTQAFSQRRKTVRNALRTLIGADALTALDIDPGVRPENLDIDDFVRIANAVMPEQIR